ncbi:transmembrane protein 70 homolog, mitochondrial [Scaptodrosophila lebanonensis]|uniref:Transmembrane protein 70 homolog, mitochondrial n=1 Tax=Drosophila lebanonensis TaxID=7225 RepID=A0A6J2TYP2_DROLE|nr:transmembrane protein 70 homolog, mitochondrial [Scaptodrosophila lebanonensis]
MFTMRAALPCGKQFASILTKAYRGGGSTATGLSITIAGRTAAATAVPHRWYAAGPASPAAAADDGAKGSGLKRIYYGTLASRMKVVKVFSLTTSLAGLAAQPILLEQGMKIGGTGLAVFICTTAGFFTFVTPLLLHFITKKYVTELHYNPSTDQYIATTISLLLQKIETKFRTNDVTVPEVPGMFTSFVVGKRALFVDPALFDDPEHYVRIMGYDKPVDFKLDLSADTTDDKRTKS